jgi:hypothetical protein
MKKILLLAAMLMAAGWLEAQTIVNPEGYQLLRKSDTAVFDKKNNQIGSIEGTVAYDSLHRELGRINGNDVTRRGNLIGRIGDNRFNDNAGNTEIRLEGNNLLNSSGYTKARVQGTFELKDLALLYYFFIRKK